MEQRPPRVETIDWHARYPQEIVLHGPTDRRQVALTFDDGPDDLWTPQVLDVLRQLRVPATFLCVGQRVQRYPEMVRRMVAEGHVVGNHSWSHPNLTQLSAAEVQSQIARTNAVLRAEAGVQPRWLRPPYGALNDTVIHTAQALRMNILFWDVDSLDWTGIRTDQVVANVLAHTEPGAIVLFHCAGGAGEHLDHTVAALPIVVDTLRQRGYTLVTAPVLIGQPAYL
ncbi:MAG: polysaccharide deacetylase family protein [Alicyclobacillus sp.]|nr:polysaccharide deacetylase family protein [Alicyclobacillus sp.]